MKQRENDSRLIFALSIFWGLILISLELCYCMGKTDGLVHALGAMSFHIPIYISVLIGVVIAGRDLSKTQINIITTKRHFIMTVILSLLFSPIGLFFLFKTKKYKELEI